MSRSIVDEILSRLAISPEEMQALESEARVVDCLRCLALEAQRRAGAVPAPASGGGPGHFWMESPPMPCTITMNAAQAPLTLLDPDAEMLAAAAAKRPQGRPKKTPAQSPLPSNGKPVPAEARATPAEEVCRKAAAVIMQEGRSMSTAAIASRLGLPAECVEGKLSRAPDHFMEPSPDVWTLTAAGHSRYGHGGQA